VIAGKFVITEFWGGFIIYVSVGLTALDVMGSRKAGRAKYAPLWRCGGGEARTADREEKTANMDVCGFFYFSAPGYGRGLSLPL
jgi:hypothetical protein